MTAIHHPGVRLRPADELLAELAAAYDPVYGQASRRRSLDLGHSLLLMLIWPQVDLGFPPWTQTAQGVLATVGMPLLHCPPGEASAMLTADALARHIARAGGRASNGLGYCGGYFAAALAPIVERDSPDRPQPPLLLATNYLGEVPLYRAKGQAEGGTVTVWSNKAAAAAMLAGTQRALDHTAASEYIILSHVLDDRTLYRDVKAEPPATVITLDAAGITRRSYLDLPAAYFEHRRSAAEVARDAVAGMGPLVQALRESDAPGRVHLTGGMDSRAVAAVFKHHGYQVPCTTHGGPNEEAPAARRLAKFLGMPYQVVNGAEATEEAFFAHTGPSLWQSDGLMSLKYLAGTYDLALVRDEGYLPIEGLGGEYGRAYYYGDDKGYEKLSKGDFSKLLGKAIGGRGPRWPDPAVPQGIREHIEAYLDRAVQAGLDAWQASTFYYVNQKMRHWATARRNVGWTWVIDPLQMPCWTLPAMAAEPREQMHDALIRAVAEHAAPGIRAVPTVPELARWARLRRVAGNRLVRTSLNVYDRLRRPDPEPMTDRGLRRLRGVLCDVLERGRPEIGAVLSPEVARRALDDQPWTYDQTELFWHALTLASWCRQFLAAPPPIAPAAAAAPMVAART